MCVPHHTYALTFQEFEKHISRFPFFVQSVSLYIDTKMIRSLNCSGRILFCLFWISRSRPSVVCPGKIFHSNSTDSPSIPFNSRYSAAFMNHSIFSCTMLYRLWVFMNCAKTNHRIRINAYLYFQQLGCPVVYQSRSHSWNCSGVVTSSGRLTW